MDMDSAIRNIVEAVMVQRNRHIDQVDDKSILEIVRYIESSDGLFRKKYKQASKMFKEAKKNAHKAEQYRMAGSFQHALENYVEALELFNQSICFAPKGSHDLGKGYASRSAVYFSLKMYDTCLENIELARKAGCTQSETEKLNERQAKCKKLLKSIENEFNGLKPELSYSPHEKVPFIANCLNLKKNQRFGRHIVTNADLKVGDVVAIERPFCGVTATDIRYNCCANCLEDNDLSLIPCFSCHSTMFCSKKCHDEAKADFHQIECPVIDVIHEIEMFGKGSPTLFDAQQRVMLRILIWLVNSFQSVGELMEFVKKVDSCEHNAFTVDHQINDRTELMAAFLKLERNEEKMCPTMKKSVGANTGLFYNFLLKNTDLGKKFKTGPEINFLIELIFRLELIVVLNSTSIGVPKIVKLEREDEYEELEVKTGHVSGVCHGVYLFSSLLNHSCAPNAHQFKHGTNNVIVVVKPITAGEQLFVSYGYNHREHDRQTRQKELKLYMFDCDCIACERDYPELGKQDAENREFIKPVLHSILCREYEVDIIKQVMPKYADFLNANSRAHYPNKFTGVVEMILIKFLNIAYTEKLNVSAKQKLGLFNTV